MRFMKDISEKMYAMIVSAMNHLSALRTLLAIMHDMMRPYRLNDPIMTML